MQNSITDTKQNDVEFDPECRNVSQQPFLQCQNHTLHTIGFGDEQKYSTFSWKTKSPPEMFECPITADLRHRDTKSEHERD